MDDQNPFYKIILLSSGYPGKTCLINRYINNTYLEDVCATSSSSFQIKDVILNNGIKITVHIWDSSGSETFMSLNKIFLKNSKGIILLYDITQKSSLEKTINCTKYTL